MKFRTLLIGAGTAVATIAMAASANAAVFSTSHVGNNGTIAVLTLNGSVAVNSYDIGWYDSTGIHNTSNTNYITTVVGDGFGATHNNWFAFDLSNLSGPVTSATLTLNSYSVTGTHVYNVYDFGGSVAGLTAGTGGLAAFNDLASGDSYGSFAYSPADSNVVRTLTLNAAAVADISGAFGGTFALGGTLNPAAAPEPQGGVPEPATWAFMLMGFAAMGCVVRSRRLTAAA